ncbi:MAG TPA: hypothetical protein VGF94_17095 [Kofleriaceae bacterium]
MIRFLIFILLAGAIGYCGATVPIGNKTLFGHIRAIWHSPQTQDLKNGVKETAGPTVHKVERGIEGGYHAMQDSIDAGLRPAPEHEVRGSGTSQ